MTFTWTFSAEVLLKTFLMKFSSIQGSISPILASKLVTSARSKRGNLPQSLRRLAGGGYLGGRREPRVTRAVDVGPVAGRTGNTSGRVVGHFDCRRRLHPKIVSKRVETRKAKARLAGRR